MIAYELFLLLRIHQGLSPGSADVPVSLDALERFKQDELIGRDAPGDGYKLLPRGAAYVKFLEQMPLPQAQWVTPGDWRPSLLHGYKPPEAKS
jgi:hypothetical protein